MTRRHKCCHCGQLYDPDPRNRYHQRHCSQPACWRASPKGRDYFRGPANRGDIARQIAQKIGIPHDEARMRYPLRANTVSDFDEFSCVLGDYYNYHFTQCVSQGGALSKAEARSRAEEILEKEYRRRGGTIVSAFNDAHEGTNGGLRVALDTVAEGLKAECLQRYTREVFDRHVAPNSWGQKVEIIRQFLGQCGASLSPAVRAEPPERYAHNYEDLIRSYVEALQRTSSVFRRL